MASPVESKMGQTEIGKLKIGLAIARFYPDLAQSLEAGAEDIFKNLGFEIKKSYVPGCAELPLMAQKLFEQNCSAVVCLGVVIRGETSHYDSVCRIYEQGVLQVQLKYSKPCISGVLMTENRQQAEARLSEKHHQGKKSAQACVDMLNSLKDM